MARGSWPNRRQQAIDIKTGDAGSQAAHTSFFIMARTPPVMRTGMRPSCKRVNSAWFACGNWGRSCADRAWISTRSVCSTAKSYLPAFVRQDLRRQGVARHLLGAPERDPLALQDQLIAENLQSNTGGRSGPARRPDVDQSSSNKPSCETYGSGQNRVAGRPSLPNDLRQRRSSCKSSKSLRHSSQ